MSKVTAINIIIKKKNQLRKHKEGYVSYINIDEVLVWLNDIQKELEGDMTKFNVVRYWDTYPDGTVATCDTEEEAEKICNEYRRNCKPMYDYLVRKEGE